LTGDNSTVLEIEGAVEIIRNIKIKLREKIRERLKPRINADAKNKEEFNTKYRIALLPKILIIAGIATQLKGLIAQISSQLARESPYEPLAVSSDPQSSKRKLDVRIR
jgi:hypothetical protein